MTTDACSFIDLLRNMMIVKPQEEEVLTIGSYLSTNKCKLLAISCSIDGDSLQLVAELHTLKDFLFL